MRQAQYIKLTEHERLQLQWHCDREDISKKVAERAKMILLANLGLSNIVIAKELGTTRQKVARWRQRYNECGIQGITKDATRPGRKAELPDTVVSQVIEMTLKEKPKVGEVWTQKLLAESCGISTSSVSRIWKKYGIGPKISQGNF